MSTPLLYYFIQTAPKQIKKEPPISEQLPKNLIF